MDDDVRAHVRIHVKTGTDYYAVETIADVESMMRTIQQDEFLPVTCVHAQRLFGEEQALIRAGEVVSIQEISEAGWMWQIEATEKYYARQMVDQLPNELIAEAQQKLVKILSDEDVDE